MKQTNFDLDGMLQELQNRNRSKAGDFTSTEEFKAKLYERIEAEERQRSRKHLRFYHVCSLAAAVVIAAAGAIFFMLSQAKNDSLSPREDPVVYASNTGEIQPETETSSELVPAGEVPVLEAPMAKSVRKFKKVYKMGAGIGLPEPFFAPAASPPANTWSTMESMPQTNFNTEEYKTFEENPFLSTLTNPLSTFGADIDTASYTNARRMLLQNHLPDRDAVRIEEFVNFFSYHYPQPEPGKKFSVTFESMAAPWQKNNRLLLIGVQAETIPVQKLPPANYVFLIDNSGSMSDDLPIVCEAMKTLLNQLRKSDRLSIVTYGGEVRTHLDGISAGNIAEAQKVIANLNCNGYTPGGQGIQTAYKLAHKHFIKGGNNRIVLITDGDFNVGVSSESELVKMVEKERSNAIYLSVLGVGMGNYKENKLKMLANKGNGNCFYIDNLREARQSLKACFANRMFAIAKDVKFQLEFNPSQVQSYRLLGYEMRKLNDRDFNDDTKDSGEIGVGCQVTALYEIVPTGAQAQDKSVDDLKYQQRIPVKSQDILTCKLRYQPVEGKAKSTLQSVILPKWPAATENIRWASCPAEFALLLRNSPHKGSANYNKLLKRARQHLGDDPNGDRAEFLTLVRNAGELTPKQ